MTNVTASGGRRVFVSATSNGLKSYRALATEVLAAQGFVPVVQEHFPTPSRELILAIRESVTRASAGLFIVGPAYGFPSPVPCGGRIPGVAWSHPDERLSYSQYEFLYFQTLPQPCLVLMTEDRCDLEGLVPEEPRLQSLQADYRRHIEGNRGSRVGWQRFADPFGFAKALSKFRWHEWMYA